MWCASVERVLWKRKDIANRKLNGGKFIKFWQWHTVFFIFCCCCCCWSSFFCFLVSKVNAFFNSLSSVLFVNSLHSNLLRQHDFERYDNFCFCFFSCLWFYHNFHLCSLFTSQRMRHLCVNIDHVAARPNEHSHSHTHTGEIVRESTLECEWHRKLLACCNCADESIRLKLHIETGRSKSVGKNNEWIHLHFIVSECVIYRT